MRRSTNRAPSLSAWLTALVLAAGVVLVPAVSAGATATVLRDHPHEGTEGALPAAAAEGYNGRTGKVAGYTGTTVAADGSTSIRFAGTAATYFTDSGLSSSTGELVWSAPVLVPSLPPSGAADRFLAARTSSAALGAVQVTPGGQLQIRSGSGSVAATATTSLAVGTWYRIEVLFANGQVTVRRFDMNGVLLDTLGPAAVTAGTPTVLRTGLALKGGPILIDHVQVGDDWLTAVPSPPPFDNPCGSLAAQYDAQNPPHYDHVVVIMEENWSYHDFASSTQAPYLTSLAAGCGDETNFHNATHPSQPNYMAATSGIVTNVGAMTGNDNIFAQLQAGSSWKSYQESMATPCQGTSSATYKPGHNPAYWYTTLRSPVNTCATNDVPMSPALDDDLTNDTLPAFSWLSANECHEFYWVKACSTPQSQRIQQGDAWLAAMVPRLAALPSYQQGRTLIVITFDEGRENTNTNYVDCTDPAYYPAHPDCQVPTVVVSPYLQARADNSDQNLYSLLGTIQDNFGLPRLGRAAAYTQSLRPGLGF
jgi:hypothetical protein